MEYQQYLRKIKDRIKNFSRVEWAAVLFAVLIILGGVIFLSNPQKRLLEMRNSQRRSDVVNILNAVHKYYTDNGNILPKSIEAAPTMICKSTAQSCEGLADISEIIEKEKKILSEVPVDPKVGEGNSTGYEISKSASSRIKVSAPLAENGAVITLSK